MTPQRPTELVTASQACGEAYLKRDAMIEAGDVVGVIAMNTALDILDRRYNSLYQQWQILGGTSDIDSITFPQVDYSHADALDEQRTREEARM